MTKRKQRKITSEYVLCPSLKCGGYRSGYVCYLKCNKFKRGTCETINRIYRGAGYVYETKRIKRKRKQH